MSLHSQSTVPGARREGAVNTDVLEIELDNVTRDALCREMERGVSSPYVDGNRAIREASRIFYSRIPESVLATIERLVLDPEGPSAIHFSNLPIDRSLPITPPDGHDVSGKKTFVTEGVLMGIGRVLGHPYAFKDEKRGQIVQQVCPVPKSAKQLSNEGSLVGLGMHVENSFSEFRPHHQLLLCLRGDTEHKALTGIASGRAIASRLSPEHLATACRAEFRIQCPPSFAATGQDAYSEPVAIFSGPRERAELRIDLPECMECLTDRASETFAAIQAAFEEPGVVRNIDFQPGEALVLANRRITHSRTVFTPRYDGTDRWLQRMFIISDPWQFRALVDARLRVI